jgi:hypothetical protein
LKDGDPNDSFEEGLVLLTRIQMLGMGTMAVLQLVGVI